MNKEMGDQISIFLQAGEAAAQAITQRRNLPVECGHIENALVEVLSLRRSTDLLPLGLTANAIVTKLGEYDFRKFFPVLLAEIPFEESILPVGIPRRLVEQRVRRHGQVWQINQNDADPFPSNPHAHNVELGYKLDLGTGDLFLGRQSVGKKISQKDSIAIRECIAHLDLPPLS
jgi:hypothetical protein